MIEAEAIRDAFAALADEAPAADRIHATLAGRARRHRQRRMVLRVAGAGALAATAGVAAAGAWRLTRPSDPGFPVVDGGPGGGWLEVPLRFRPSWLPHRYGEVRRGFIVVGDEAPMHSRDYGPDANGGIQLVVGWHASMEEGRPTGPSSTVDINGVAGQVLQVGDGQVATYVTWQPSGAPQLIVSVVGGADADGQRDVAVRVARSVRPDTALMWIAPRFGWLPPGLAGRPWQVTLEFDGVEWMQGVTVTGPDARQLGVSMGPGIGRRFETTAASVPIRIGDWSGRHMPEIGQLFLTATDGVEIFVQLDGDSGGEVIRVMEEFDSGPWPDMSWVGQR